MKYTINYEQDFFNIVEGKNEVIFNYQLTNDGKITDLINNEVIVQKSKEQFAKLVDKLLNMEMQDVITIDDSVTFVTIKTYKSKLKCMNNPEVIKLIETYMKEN